jgi:5-(carboxyamino)imidazole ribonucleotide synthase
MMNPEISPSATLGVLGSGQLGRMFAIEARRLGYRVQVYSPEADTPTEQVTDREWIGAYDDLDLLTEFSRHVDVVTLEFENIPAVAVDALEQRVPVRPGRQVLEAAQHRIREKQTMQRIGLPTAEFVPLEAGGMRNDESAGDGVTVERLRGALERVGGRGVLKTASFGYDGKGQRTLDAGDDLEAVCREYARQDAILEAFVDFQRELSVIAVRSPAGEVRCYDPIVNTHANHILDVSVSPAGLDEATVLEAREIARTVMESLEVIGVLCVEMFHAADGRLLVNEIAPRPHNSGHLTIDAHYCCQFNQQVRAVCGLPLGSTRQRQPAAMANLLGDLWIDGQPPPWSRILEREELKLHLYGKTEARPGRKMGHLTCLANDAETAASLARSARDELFPPV